VNAVGMVCAKHYVVRGRVQGVGYRYFVLEAAERYGIRGYARNLAGGDVEVRAEGDDLALQLFKEELQRGPRMARVSEIVENEVPLSGQYSSFLIRG
jgi:acylphosphatase